MGAQICEADLPDAIATILAEPPLDQMQWGIQVQPLGSTRTLIEVQADRYFVPASNVKLMTTAAVLHKLGPTFRLHTTVYRLPSSDGSAEPTVEPSLRVQLVGQADPSLTDREFHQLADQLRSQGIHQISQLWVDDSYVADEPINPTWEWEDIQAGYGAPVNSLILNRNEVPFSLMPQAIGQPLRLVWDDPVAAYDWQVDNQTMTVGGDAPEWVEIGRDLAQPSLQIRGQLRAGAAPETASIAVVQPTNHALERFRNALEAAGIRVEASAIATAPLPPNAVPVANIASPPLAELVQTANQDSENIYAEALLRILGRESGLSPQPDDSSLSLGLRAVRSELESMGVPGDAFDLSDGSGLSRHNLATPAALVQTLQAMATSPNAEVYRQSLAIAGISGTLQNRFHNTAVAGHMWGKTGALSGVAALSGYLDPPQFDPLVFSILVNHFSQPVREVRPRIDQIVVLLSQLHSCPAPNPP